MDNCNCVEPLWAADDMQMKYQYFADFLIALAYFSIPCELVYFVKKSALFPYRWVLVLFGAFIVLCGTTHFINLWTFGVHARTVAIVMTVAKLLTALVSCATALTLVHVIPDLLSVKTREHFLRNKADELDREMGIIRNQEETGRYVRMLTQEIRSTLDKNTILKTTLVELGKTLALEECTVWMPAKNGMELTLEHSFRQTKMHRVKATVPIHHPSLQQVFSQNRAQRIPSTSPVAMAMLRPSSGRISTGDVLGVRVPLLHLTDFEIGDWPEPAKKLYALMVLALPSDSARKWRSHELELVENVSEQVAVALSHAAVLEQSTRDRNQLLEQNRALSLARHEAETAIHARNDFFAVMNYEMKTPMDAIISSSMLLQGSELSAEQRSMVETIVKNSKLLSTLIADVLDISRLEDGTFQLSNLPFNVPWMFQEVIKLVRPVALMKKLSLHMNFSSEIPEYAIGDQKRLMQTVLNIVGNAVKFTKEGNITVNVSIDKSDESSPALHLQHILGEQYMPIRVEVKDTGIGLSSQEIPKLFNKFVQANSASRKQYGGTGLSLAICKKFVSLMGGDIWIESEGPGKGTTVTFVVKLGCFNEMERQLIPSIQASGVQIDLTGLKVLLVDGHSVNRMVMKGLLMRLGCDVTDASTGRECLQLLFQVRLRFKVILIDVCLSDMDGFDVLVWIREKFAPHERPSIGAFLPNADPSVQRRCQELGVAVLGYKPVSLEKMQNLLTGIVQRGGLITQTR